MTKFRRRRSLSVLLMPILLSAMVSAPLSAQQATPTKDTQPTDWRAYAEHLKSNARVSIRLTDGSKIDGRLVQTSSDGLQVRPKGTAAYPTRELRWTQIESVEEKWGPGKKTALWASLIGAYVLLVLIHGVGAG